MAPTLTAQSASPGRGVYLDCGLSLLVLHPPLGPLPGLIQGTYLYIRGIVSGFSFASYIPSSLKRNIFISECLFVCASEPGCDSHG